MTKPTLVAPVSNRWQPTRRLTTVRDFRAIFIGFVFAAALFTAPAGFAATAPCLSEDAPADAAQLKALRAQVETTCPCDGFVADGKKSAHRDYVACAKGVVKAALEAGQLRPKCKSLALYPVSRSTCGQPTDPPRSPCTHRSPKGVVKCKVTTCQRSGDLACTKHPNCLDAADTNHDGQVSSEDSGQCNPLQNCDAQKAAAMVRQQQYTQECKEDCINNPSYSLCIYGCGFGNNAMTSIIDAEFATCQVDPTRSCADLRTANLQYCSALTSPPPPCIDDCKGNATCLENCAISADCTREAENAYTACVARGD